MSVFQYKNYMIQFHDDGNPSFCVTTKKEWDKILKKTYENRQGTVCTCGTDIPTNILREVKTIQKLKKI